MSPSCLSAHTVFISLVRLVSFFSSLCACKLCDSHLSLARQKTQKNNKCDHLNRAQTVTRTRSVYPSIARTQIHLTHDTDAFTRSSSWRTNYYVAPAAPATRVLGRLRLPKPMSTTTILSGTQQLTSRWPSWDRMRGSCFSSSPRYSSTLFHRSWSSAALAHARTVVGVGPRAEKSTPGCLNGRRHQQRKTATTTAAVTETSAANSPAAAT